MSAVQFNRRSISRMKEYDLLYKIVVIGESAVGKTSLIRRYANPGESFDLHLMSTVGIDFVNVDTKIDGLTVRLQIWDTAGQERFRTLTTNQFRGAKGVLLVFDITRALTFDRLQYWIDSLKKHKLQYEEFNIIGNKSDLTVEREVPKRKGEELAKHHGVKYMETSAKSGVNVREIFHAIAMQMKDANDPFVHVREEDFNEEDEDQIDAIIHPTLEDNLTKKKGSYSHCCTG